MDDLTAQLNQILSDPEQMAQISQLASSLGLGQQSEPTEPAREAPDESDAMSETLGKLLPLLTQSGGKEAQVFRALRPYLSPENQQRADRALRAAKLSRLAKVALKEFGDGTLGGLL